MRTKLLIACAWFVGPGAAFTAIGSTISVTTYSDTMANDGKCSLREAITSANTNTASGAAAGECVAGSVGGSDTIVYSVAEFCQITGCVTNLLTPLPDIATPMSIVGPGSLALQPGGGAKIRIFNVTAGSLATPTSISGFIIRNGDIVDVDGGAGVRTTAPALNLTNCVFRNNKVTGTANSRQGGGLLNLGSTVNLTNCTFDQNNARRGGGIFNDGPLTVTGSTFSSNVAGTSITNGQGGGIAEGTSATATVVVTNCTFTNNFAGERGGAILTDGPTFTITGCSITSNKTGNGGAISNFGTCNVVNSVMVGNLAGEIAGAFFRGAGGAIDNNGTLNLTNTTISGNMADSNGGGILNFNGPLSVTNCTIAGNSTSAAFDAGGGIHSVPTTVGMFQTNPTANIKSSIVAGNSSTTGPDVMGNVTSSGFNLIGKKDGSAGFTAATDHTGTAAAPLDPKLDPNGPQNNGGPTMTIALLPGSPAIDKGTSAGLTGNLTTDQRGSGFPRILDDGQVVNATGGDGADIGAFESQMPLPTRLANISTRLRVETGDNALIGGFIITGTQDKKVIVRALGPSLPLAERLLNPTLELRDSSGALLESNDNWVSSPNKQAIMDSTIPPSDDLESAIVRSLPANNAAYTAIVRGLNNTTGIGVVEAFDLDAPANSKLANISTRGFVQTDPNILIAGTFITGPTPQKLIVRAIGPSLSLPGKLENPTMELRDQNGGLVEANDNWVDSPNKQAIMDSGVAPTNDLESAIVQTLPANGASFTAIVRGVNGTTGIGVVEMYALQ